MSHIWTFSVDSQPLLQRCLAAAAPPDDSNKWLQKFEPRNLSLLQNPENTVVLTDSPEVEDHPTNQEIQDENVTKSIEEFLDPELDIISKFNDFVKVGRKDPCLLTKLSQTLPLNTTEKIFAHIFDSEDLSNEFLEHFYSYFVIDFIKHDKTRFCSDILLKTYHKRPQYFKGTLKLILKDLHIENNIFTDFIYNLNPNEQSEIINIVTNIDLSSEEFVYNLFNISTCYKTCTKTEKIQDSVRVLLKNHSSCCSNDKNYGKMLLVFLQQEKSIRRGVDVKSIEEIIEIHKSPFKRACLSVLKDIKEGN